MVTSAMLVEYKLKFVHYRFIIQMEIKSYRIDGGF